MTAVDVLFEWLLDGAPGVTAPLEIAERTGRDLRSAGIPLDRLGVFITTLHPNVLGRAFFWERDRPARMAELTREIRESTGFRHSPVAWCTEHGQEWRWRAGEPDQGYGAIRDLSARGCVDYVALPIRFTTGEMHVVSFASERGFSDDDLGALRRITRPLARLAEIYAMRRTAANVLSTYVGALSGERVLAGRIHRGDVETIRAVIWFSDLRGFTERTSRTAPAEMIALLNDVFDCQVPAIEARGGEVLKFIGDGLLAIFPITETAPAAERCRAALEAASAAFAALDALNARTGESLALGLALHAGDVAYGNIGGASRLDFTAIGTAVNLAARLEGIASKLGRRMVVSAELAAMVDHPFEDLGQFELKGIAGPQRVFGWR